MLNKKIRKMHELLGVLHVKPQKENFNLAHKKSFSSVTLLNRKNVYYRFFIQIIIKSIESVTSL